MMLRYAIALPTAYELGSLGVALIKAKKAGKNFSEFYGSELLETISKGFNSTKGEGKKALAIAIIKIAKIPLILTGIGAIGGIGMKKLVNDNPDNKFIKYVNRAANLLGI